MGWRAGEAGESGVPPGRGVGAAPPRHQPCQVRIGFYAIYIPHFVDFVSNIDKRMVF